MFHATRSRRIKIIASLFMARHHHRLGRVCGRVTVGGIKENPQNGMAKINHSAFFTPIISISSSILAKIFFQRNKLDVKSYSRCINNRCTYSLHFEMYHRVFPVQTENSILVIDFNRKDSNQIILHHRGHQNKFKQIMALSHHH